IESMTDYFGIDKTILPQGISSVFSNKTTEITGKMLLNAAGFNLEEVKVNAINTSGAGSVNAVFGEEFTTIYFNMDFNKLDFDKLMEGGILKGKDESSPEGEHPSMNQAELLKEGMKDASLEERNA